MTFCHNMQDIILLCPCPGDIKRWCCLTSVKSGLGREWRGLGRLKLAHHTWLGHHFQGQRSRSFVLWLAVLAGQHGHWVSDRSICVYGAYRVTTCRPGRGHIGRLQLVWLKNVKTDKNALMRFGDYSNDIWHGNESDRETRFYGVSHAPIPRGRWSQNPP